MLRAFLVVRECVGEFFFGLRAISRRWCAGAFAAIHDRALELGDVDLWALTSSYLVPSSAREDVHGPCPHCGSPVRTTIPVIPMQGSLADKLVVVDPQEDILIVFRGGKAMSCIRAPWVGSYTFRSDRIYAKSRLLGPVRIVADSLKVVETRLGRAFVRVEQGVLVNRGVGPLAMDESGRMIGIVLGRNSRGDLIIEWVVASRMHWRTIRPLLKVA